MDVDSDNFEEAYALLVERLKSAAFVALDLEMTGIRSDGGAGDDNQDLPEERYKKKRQAAALYGIVQVGLCLFEHAPPSDSSGKHGSYVARPFNFFIFPRPVNETPDCFISPKIALDADAMHFVRCSGLDFGRWLGKGIPYLDRMGEDNLKNALGKRTVTEDKYPTDDSARAEAKGIEDSQGGAFGPSASHVLTGKGAKQQQAILQAMRDRRKADKVVLERRPGPLAGCRPPVVTMRNLGPDASALQNWVKQERQEADRFLAEQTGFRRVWKALLKAGRPLVLHNGLLDLLFAYQWLEEPLPESFPEFEGILERTMPSGSKVFDTKWIASYTEVGQKLGPQQKNGLEALCAALDRQGAGAAPHVTFPDGFDKYAGAGDAFHEAAYDAYCTGRLFAHFCSAAQYSLGAPVVVPEPVVAVLPKLRVLEKAAPKKKAAVANRFALLDSDDESEGEEEEDEEEEEEEDESRGPPPRPTVASAGNRIFLMACPWDFSWGSQASALPVHFAAEGRRVAVRYVYGLRKGLAPQDVAKSVQQAWHQVSSAQAGGHAPSLEIRWSGKDVACVLLAPRDRSEDDAWQDPEKLGNALEATLKKACSGGGGAPFEWCEERAKVFAKPAAAAA